MAMATPKAPAGTRPAISFCMCLLFFVIMVATVNTPALVKAARSTPVPMVLFLHEDRISPNKTVVVVASASGVLEGPPQFGTIAVMSHVVREGEAPDSLVLGQASGQTTVVKGSLYFAFAYVVNTTSCAGSITVEGPTDLKGNGELAITGGTGDFRWARGYVDFHLISEEDQSSVVFKSFLYITYD